MLPVKIALFALIGSGLVVSLYRENLAPRNAAHAKQVAGVPQSEVDILRIRGERNATYNETELHCHGVVTGRVTTEDGKPVSGIVVVAHFQASSLPSSFRLDFGEGLAVTDSNGEYRLHGLSAKRFMVSIGRNGDGPPYMTDTTQSVDVEAAPDQTVSHCDFVVHPGPLVTVHIHDAQTGEPIAGVAIATVNRIYNSTKVRGTTDAKGEVRFHIGTLDQYLQISREEAEKRRITSAPGYSLGYHVQLKKSESVFWDIKTYSQTRSANTVFHGIVTDPEGKPVENATVWMMRNRGMIETRSASTNSRGEFSFSTDRIKPEEYDTNNPEKRPGILIQAEKLDIEKPSLYVLHYTTPEETWSEIPLRLGSEMRTCEVTGQIVDPEGKPLPGVPLNAHEEFQRADVGTVKHFGVSGKDGRFTLRGLSPEAGYAFDFGDWPETDRFGMTSVPPERTESHWEWTHFKPGERRDLGQIIVWPANRPIAGHIMMSDGHGPPAQGKPGALRIVVKGAHTTASCAVAGGTGAFHLPRVAREPLELYVYASSSGNGWSTGSGSRDEVAHQTVEAGDEDVRVMVK